MLTYLRRHNRLNLPETYVSLYICVSNMRSREGHRMQILTNTGLYAQAYIHTNIKERTYTETYTDAIHIKIERSGKTRVLSFISWSEFVSGDTHFLQPWFRPPLHFLFFYSLLFSLPSPCFNRALQTLAQPTYIFSPFLPQLYLNEPPVYISNARLHVSPTDVCACANDTRQPNYGVCTSRLYTAALTAPAF